MQLGAAFQGLVRGVVAALQGHVAAACLQTGLGQLPQRTVVVGAGLQGLQRQALLVPGAVLRVAQLGLDLPARTFGLHLHVALQRGVRCLGPQNGQVQRL